MCVKWWFGLVVLAVLSLALGLSVGSSELSLFHLFGLSESDAIILFQIRLPRVLTAFLVGGLLASAGASFQGILNNPLADPYILGVSSGAGLGATLMMLSPLVASMAYAIPFGAFLGACGSIFLVYGIVKMAGKGSVLHFILAGIVVNACLSALMMLILFFLSDDSQGVLHWLLGDLSQLDLGSVGMFYLVSTPVVGALALMGYRISVLACGDDGAASLGISVPKLRFWVFILASFATGIAVASAGIIGFVGLIIPHVLRFMKVSDFRFLIPFSWIVGGSFMVVCDAVSRSIIAPQELPVGVLSALLGSPLFIGIMWRYFMRRA